MKILLINPYHRVSYLGNEKMSPILPPMGLAYIAAVLIQNKIAVKIIDLNLNLPSKIDFIHQIKEEEPDIIGITSSTPVINNAFRLCAEIKAANPETITVLGGPHPTALPKDTVSNENVDVVVVGEGEYTFLDLIRAIEEKKDLSQVEGIVFKKNGEIISNPLRPLIEDLDELPLPAYELLEMDKYYSPQTKTGKFANILTSRGCPARCIYCNKKIFGTKFRARSVNHLLNEIEFLINNYGIREFHILDDLFTANKKRVREFCYQVLKKKLDIKWKCPNGVRVNTVDYELLKLMNQAGCYSISFGVESGNSQILKNIRKGITLEQSENAIKWAKKAGLFTVAFLMIGNLGENRQTIQDTINFTKKIDPDAAQFSILIPYPGTPIRDIILKEGKLLTNRWEDYDNEKGIAIFEHGELNKNLMEEMVKKAYNSFYFRPSYILKRILKIRNLHDLKTYINGFRTILTNFLNSVSK
ncbi:MAG: B12-binding domain-containing radical SAM protein [Candidatus Helarchaeota archaeon]